MLLSQSLSRTLILFLYIYDRTNIFPHIQAC